MNLLSPRRAYPLRLRQLLLRLFGVSGVILALVAAAGAAAYVHLTDARNVVLKSIDPSQQLLGELNSDYLEQATGVRGYVLTGQIVFLHGYNDGKSKAAVARVGLERMLTHRGTAPVLLATVVQRYAAWTGQYAQPAVAAVSSGDRSAVTAARIAEGDASFVQLSASVSALQRDLDSARASAQSNLAAASDALGIVLCVALAVVVGGWVVIWTSLRRLVVHPLSDVAADIRAVASGDLQHHVAPAGPAEVRALAEDAEAMRVKVVSEVEQVNDARAEIAAVNEDLARSNQDLEQFAYVASHDLQEPLRKVTSFCQLLEQRYAGQLDERGERYIAFAVDGAKRMQVLINDLLAFSRIGRTTDRFEPVSLEETVELAERNLANAIETTEASVEVADELPTVAGDRTLLVALMQNLISNAVKFRADRSPEVRIGCHPVDGEWVVSVSDNGIGIEPRFAERIFVIFQRLHGRDEYSGTGIGLALCRKIVEFHGGRIWLDVDYTGGSRFCFTLPRTTPEETMDEPDAVVESS